MLSISDFSEMCALPTQTLRFYHSEGLLVPAEVDERTGYRSYTFEQVETAMLVMVLRGAGLSVKQVRQALDAPDTVPALLEEHTEALHRRREAEDEALREAHAFVHTWPQVRRSHTPDMTVVSKVVPPTPHTAGDHYDWDAVGAAVASTVGEVTAALEARGATVAGTPWRGNAVETPEQRERSMTLEGPHWLVKVPVEAPSDVLADLPPDMEVQTFEGRDELVVFIPGKETMAKHATALSWLTTHSLEEGYLEKGYVADTARVRTMLSEDGVESRACLLRLDSLEGLDSAEETA
ncbi:MerR family transcriptional regulator [Nocardiopsis ansamitocini]|uniref:HTH merR-type domain-containing protein n=1 Tax=Nocardiopsis ansamitocini TaxID=1670832 RepID=A0A9W6P7A8_9ACTN|nr:MerR family transcriptional regulator [Nocardiopsis ansamitocini]GLU48384.1 hypothetical protein Nans01_27350 [Nocardiopsis ansamitocini]